MKAAAITDTGTKNLGRNHFSARFGVLGLLSTIVVTMSADSAFAFTTTTTDSIPNQATRSSSIACGNTCGWLLPRKRRMSQRKPILRASSTDHNDGDKSDAIDSTTPPQGATGAVGLYKQYAEYASKQLLGTGWLQEDTSVPEHLSANQAPARGAKPESIVRITTQALVPPNESQSLLRYARITLLETVPLELEEDSGAVVVSSNGIQVLNFVVLPNANTNLPVLGIDMVSLPGSKHLLLLDAQPMAEPNPHESHWEDWYKKHVSNDETKEEDGALRYAWGGDFPEAVQKYVSKYALWTRLQNFDEDASAVDAIRGDLFVAFRAHLDAYLELVGQHTIEAVKGDNHQPAYLDYRRNNDPAKPMLNSLYGPEWTQSLLDNVLFPKD